MLGTLYFFYHLLTFVSVAFAQETIGILAFLMLAAYAAILAFQDPTLRASIPLLSLLALTIVVICIRLLIVDSVDIKQVAFVPHVLLSIVVWRRFPAFPHRETYWAMAVLTTLYILTATDLGNSLTVNRTFLNAYAFVLFACAALFDKHHSSRSINVALLTVLSIITVSRSGLILSWILFASLVLGSRQSRSSKITIVLIPPMVLLVGSLFLSEFATTLTLRLAERGFGSGRWDFWPWYIGQLNFYTFTFGFDTEQFYRQLSAFFFRGEPLTMHNSFFQFQTYFGIVSPLLFLYSVAITIRLLRRDRWRGLVLAALLVRGCFDTILLVQRFDFILLCIIAVFSSQLRTRRDTRSRYSTKPGLVEQQRPPRPRVENTDSAV